jgi:hypothetical protein
MPPPQLDLDVADLQPELGELLRGPDQLDDAQQVLVREVVVAHARMIARSRKS